MTFATANANPSFLIISVDSTHIRDLAKASKRVAKNPFFGKFYLMWSKECVKTTTML